MAGSFELSLKLSAVYSSNAPTLNIFYDGALLSSVTVDALNKSKDFDTFSTTINFAGFNPDQLSFAVSGIDTGTAVVMQKVLINGQDIAGVGLSGHTTTNKHGQAVLYNGDSTDANSSMIAGITTPAPEAPPAYADGRTLPTASEFGSPSQSGAGTDDYLGGTNGTDVITAGGGNDDVRGGRGDDRITGDAGDDELYGHDGNRSSLRRYWKRQALWR